MKAEKNGPLVIFDVGSNHGDYAKLVLSVFNNDKVKLFLFEPSKKTFAKLQNNIKSNANVTFENIGLGAASENVSLYSSSNEQLSGLSSLFERDLKYRNLALDQNETVRIETLDRYCEAKGIKRIDYIKLDVEGNELNVLKGASKMLNQIKYIQFEFGGCNIDSRTYFRDFYNLLSKSGFKLYRIMQDGLCEIKKYTEAHEMFITTNFLAERKNSINR